MRAASRPARNLSGPDNEGRERSKAVRRAVNSLPIELRQIIVMKEFEDLTFREIADALELP